MSRVAKSNSIAICVGHAEQAKLGALYFDYIIPILCEGTPREVFPPQAAEWDTPSSVDAIEKLQQSNGKKGVGIELSHEDGSTTRLKLTDRDGHPDYNALEHFHEHLFAIPSSRSMKWLRTEMRNSGLASAPILLRGRSLDPLALTQSLDDVTVTVAGIPLLDTENVSWQQLLDFHSDQESREKLQRLRWFLADELVQKTPEQIEAAIERRQYEYEKLAAKHGFNLSVGTLQAVCSSKTLLLNVGLGAGLGSLMGGEGGTTVGALLGASLELSSISLSVAKGLHERRGALRDHPLAYLVAVKEHLAPVSAPWAT